MVYTTNFTYNEIGDGLLLFYHVLPTLPSGKRLHSSGKSTILKFGKSTN
jgi:hypothetical protein